MATIDDDCYVAVSSGHWSTTVSREDNSAAKVTGRESVAIVTGEGSKAAGALGCWLVLVEREPTDYNILGVQAVKVDGETIKPDTYYSLIDGKVVEA